MLILSLKYRHIFSAGLSSGCTAVRKSIRYFVVCSSIWHDDSESDVRVLKKLPLSVTPESCIYGDAAYTDYTIEDDMLQAERVYLKISRKSNSKRKGEPWQRSLNEYI